jgi:predicted acetyltransferase
VTESSVRGGLVRPSLDVWTSFVEALREGYKLTNTDAHIPEPPEKIAAIEADPEGFLRELTNPPTHMTLADGRIIERPSQQLYWYVDGEDFIGSGSLRLELPPEFASWAGNVGYTVRPSRRGQGHASAILGGLLGIARDEHGLKRLEICADYDNYPSLRLIEKAGGVFDGTAPHLFQPGVDVRRYKVELA